MFTASGVVVGMLALQAVFDGAARLAIFYLLLTMLIDGIDGPFARGLDVKSNVPKIDGYVLDLVIDFVTCVVVPVMFMHRFDMLPDRLSLAVLGLVVFLSAIWFSRTDMMTEDFYFRGFPAVWNLIIPTLYVMEAPKFVNLGLIVCLAMLQVSDLPFPHVVRVSESRAVSVVSMAAWMGALIYGSARLPDSFIAVQVVLWISISWYAFVTFRRCMKDRSDRITSVTPVS